MKKMRIQKKREMMKVRVVLKQAQTVLRVKSQNHHLKKQAAIEYLEAAVEVVVEVFNEKSLEEESKQNSEKYIIIMVNNCIFIKWS